MRKHSFKTQEMLVQKDLEWLWHESEAAIGMRSNWPEQIRVQCKLKLDDLHNSLIQCLGVIDKRREIERTFYLLSIKEQNVLFAQFGWRSLGTFDPDLRRAFARYTPLVCHCHPEVINDNNMIDKSNKKYHAAWLEEGRLLFRQAIMAFWAGRKHYE